jgi:putative Ca2+/H+ antiporter (TMEM165/GDT1 family)
MDWKLLLAAFGTIFLAELGDKTQLATLAMAAGPGSKWAVFVGAALALALTTGLAVLGGALITEWVPVVWLRPAAGLCFLVLGAIYLFTNADA